jgi:hypothetical protein
MLIATTHLGTNARVKWRSLLRNPTVSLPGTCKIRKRGNLEETRLLNASRLGERVRVKLGDVITACCVSLLKFVSLIQSSSTAEECCRHEVAQPYSIVFFASSFQLSPSARPVAPKVSCRHRRHSFSSWLSPPAQLNLQPVCK